MVDLRIQGIHHLSNPKGEKFTDEEWKQITESIEEETCNIDLTSLTELWIDTQLDYIRKEGRERAIEFGYLVEDDEE